MSQHQITSDSPRPTYLGLKAASALFPRLRDGKPTHTSTIARWILKGIRLQDGRVIRLSAKRFPGGWGVAVEAIDEFVEVLTLDRRGEPCRSRLTRRPPDAVRWTSPTRACRGRNLTPFKPETPQRGHRQGAGVLSASRPAADNGWHHHEFGTQAVQRNSIANGQSRQRARDQSDRENEADLVFGSPSTKSVGVESATTTKVVTFLRLRR